MIPTSDVAEQLTKIIFRLFQMNCSNVSISVQLSRLLDPAYKYRVSIKDVQLQTTTTKIPTVLRSSATYQNANSI